MGHDTVTVYRCDRCGRETTMPEREQPMGWHQLTKSRPVLASPTEVESKDRTSCELCRECSEALHDWFIVERGERSRTDAAAAAELRAALDLLYEAADPDPTGERAKDEQLVSALMAADAILAKTDPELAAAHDAGVIDRFIKNRLPSLLAEALRVHFRRPWGDSGPYAQVAAALVAYIEKEARNG